MNCDRCGVNVGNRVVRLCYECDILVVQECLRIEREQHEATRQLAAKAVAAAKAEVDSQRKQHMLYIGKLFDRHPDGNSTHECVICFQRKWCSWYEPDVGLMCAGCLAAERDARMPCTPEDAFVMVDRSHPMASHSKEEVKAKERVFAAFEAHAAKRKV